MTVALPVWVLRPEPGNAATCARLTELGFVAVALPLFVVEPVAWDVPDAADHDALLLTSANAVRHAGEGLARLSTLPTYAVGTATAQAARAAGLCVTATGKGGVGAMAARLAADGRERVLHLMGHDFTALPDGFAPNVRTVYHARERAAAQMVPLLAAAPTPAYVLIHSARAAQRLSDMVDAAQVERQALHCHCLSPTIAATLGVGWASITIAESPNEAALLSGLPK